MNSRRVRRVRAAQKRAEEVLATYKVSRRGLQRVFEALVPESDAAARDIAARAVHGLAELEARLPQLREALRSARYPGAEKGDAGALVWGLWGHLSEVQHHLTTSVHSLERLGRRWRVEEPVAPPLAKRKAASKAMARKASAAKPKRRAPARRAAKRKAR
jgi:hypothetical protein